MQWLLSEWTLMEWIGVTVGLSWVASCIASLGFGVWLLYGYVTD